MCILRIMEAKASVILPVCKSVLSRLSPFLRAIDFALEWRMIDSGKALFRQDEPAECLHVVLSGRLRSVVASVDKKEALEEFGRGDLVGLVSCPSLSAAIPFAATVLQSTVVSSFFWSVDAWAILDSNA